MSVSALYLPVSIMGGKRMLTEFLVNDLRGIMANGNAATRLKEENVSLISIREKDDSSSNKPARTCQPSATS